MTVRQLLAGLAVAGVLTACSEAPAPQPARAEQAVNVVVEPLAFEPERTRAEAVGTSRARLSAELFPATSAEVVAVNFQPGQFARAGDALVELDRRNEVLAVELAELELADAKRLLERYEQSANSGAVLPTTLDAARTAAERARVELERARVALADRTITAPFDGHVGISNVDPGDRVTTNTLITTLDDRAELIVSFDLPEVFIGQLGVGGPIELETWNSDNPAVVGEVVDIGSRVDPSTRTFTVRARVPNVEDTMRPGMSFRVGVDVVGATYPVVPEISLRWGTDGAYVWTVVDGNAVRTPVSVVQRREGRVLVEGDLGASSIVVVEGTQRMRNGQLLSFETPRVAGGGGAPATGGAASASALD